MAPRFTHCLCQHSAPSSSSFVCHAPQKPLPFITPQAKSHIKMGSAPFSRSCCLGAGLGVEHRVERRLPLAYWVPTGYRHRGRCVPLCECWGGGRGQDPGHLGPRFAGSVPLGSFRCPLLPYFQSGWSFSFRGLGDRHGERAPGSSGRSEREKGGKEAQPLGVTRLRVSALGFGFGFAVTFSCITRFLLSLLPHPCLVTCRGGRGHRAEHFCC